jgi:hypothetical protein
MTNPTERYFAALIDGDQRALEELFSGLPWIDDPLSPKVREAADLEALIDARHAWLRDREARAVLLRTTRGAHRSVSEFLLQLQIDGAGVDLPVAVVGDLSADDGRITALRVYHSSWPLEGTHQVRPPLLPRDPTLHLCDIVAEYHRALSAGDVEGIVATFEPDGWFREPSGGDYVFRGGALRDFMSSLLSSGGIGLERCSATDDGVACALEFNAVRFGGELLSPQAGIGVYQRGSSGRLQSARVYDDVNVEILASR